METPAAQRTRVDAYTTTVLETARQISPVIRAHSQQAERDRRLSRPVFDVMQNAGLFRMFTPRSLGGLEVDPVTCAQVIEEVAGADSAAGWSLFNPLSWAFLSARLPDRGAEEIFGQDQNAVIAGPFHPPMQATPAKGGYRVSGRSPFASNCHEANWLASTAMVMDGDKPRMSEKGVPEVIAVFLRAEECEIFDTWHVMGMRGTGSDDIAFDKAFVPSARTCPLAPDFRPGSHFQGPLYRLSLMGEVAAAFPPIVLAIARNAIQEVSELAQQKTPFGSATLLRDRAVAQVRRAQAEATIRSARALLFQTLGETWDRILAGEPPSLRQRADLLLATVNANSSAVNVAEMMYSVAGTSGIYTKSPIERHFRDLQVLRQHGFASESRYEAVGQVYLDLPPQWAPILL